MKIEFKNIIMHNFLSFEDATLDFTDKGFVSVKGVNKNPDDNALSNGSGKSSIFEAISWCLCGETVRGTKEVTRINSDGCSVELNFDVDDKSYKLVRTKDPSNLKIYINGEDKSGKGIRDSEALLKDYLPDLTSALLGSVVILGQGLPQRLTNNTPSGRKEVLEKLSKSDFMLADIKERISTRKAALNSDLRKCEDTDLMLNTKKTSATSTINTVNAKLETLIQPSSAAVEETFKKCEEVRATYNQALLNMSDYDAKIKDLEVKLANVNAEKDKKILESINEHQTKFFSVESEKATLAARANWLKAEIAKIKSIKDFCPTCGHKLEGVQKPSTIDLEDELNDVNSKIEVYNAQVKSALVVLEETKTNINSSYAVTISNLENEIKLLNVGKNSIDINGLFSYHATLQKQYEELSAALTTYEITKSNLESQRDAAQKEIIDLDEKILYNNNVKEYVNNRLDIVNKMSNLITRDFRGYLLTNVIDYINRKAKEYSLDIFETDKVEFELDGNNINISYDGKEYPNLSGGEKQKVDVIIQFALRDMLCNYSNFSSNILVLDEISDNIDAVGAEKLFNMITNKLTDIESIYIISHHNDFDIPIDNEIVVEKGEDKISRII